MLVLWMPKVLDEKFSESANVRSTITNIVIKWDIVWLRVLPGSVGHDYSHNVWDGWKKLRITYKVEAQTPWTSRLTFKVKNAQNLVAVA